MKRIPDFVENVKIALREKVSDFDYRGQVAEKYISFLWLYDALREDNSPEASYAYVVSANAIFEEAGIKEEKIHGTHDRIDHHVSSFNPGGRHLRLLDDGNIGVSISELHSYLPRHLAAPAAQTPQAALPDEGGLLPCF